MTRKTKLFVTLVALVFFAFGTTLSSFAAPPKGKPAVKTSRPAGAAATAVQGNGQSPAATENTAPTKEALKEQLKQRVEKRLEKEGKEEPKVRVQKRTQEQLEAGEALKAQAGQPAARKPAKLEPFKGKVFLGKNELKFDQPPVIREGRLLVPLRAISEGMKAQVDWDPATKTVTVTKGDTVVVLFLDKAEVLVNGEKMALEVPAMVVNNRTLVPLRFLHEIFKGKVNYDEKTGDVTLEEEEGEAEAEEEETVAEEENATANSGQEQTSTGGEAEQSGVTTSVSGEQSPAPSETVTGTTGTETGSSGTTQ